MVRMFMRCSNRTPHVRRLRPGRQAEAEGRQQVSWTDLVCAYIVVVCIWGERLLAWRDRMVALDEAGGVFEWATPSVRE